MRRPCSCCMALQDVGRLLHMLTCTLGPAAGDLRACCLSPGGSADNAGPPWRSACGGAGIGGRTHGWACATAPLRSMQLPLEAIVEGAVQVRLRPSFRREVDTGYTFRGRPRSSTARLDDEILMT